MSESQSAAAPAAPAEASAGNQQSQANIEIDDASLEASEAEEAIAEESSESTNANPSKEGGKGSEVKQAAVKQEVKDQMQKWVLKGLKGEDIEITDVNDLIKRAQKGLGAELKFQEAASIKKEAAQLLQMIKEDPIALLEELGVNTVELSQKRLMKQLEEEQKTPEQKQRETELKELEELRKQVKDRDEAAKQAEFDKIVAEEERKLEEGIVGALNEAKLPIKPAYIKRMVEVMQAGLEHGVNLSPKEALDFAKKEVVSDLRELLDASPDDYLEGLLGDGNIKRIRKQYLAKARAKVPTANDIKSNSKVEEIQKESKPKGTVKDWLKGKVSLE